MDNKIIIFGANSSIAKELIVKLNKHYSVIAFSRKKIKVKKVLQYNNNYNYSFIIDILKRNIQLGKTRPIFLFFNSLTDKNIFINSQEKEIKDILHVNLTLPILLTNFILKNFFYTKPVFVYMSSFRFKQNDNGITLYVSTKNAILSFAKNLNFEYSKFNIAFKVILLGLFKGGLEKNLPKNIRDKILKKHNNGKFCKVKDLKKVIDHIINSPPKKKVLIDFLNFKKLI
jgi:short-subunit dehydrogenase